MRRTIGILLGAATALWSAAPAGAAPASTVPPTPAPGSGVPSSSTAAASPGSFEQQYASLAEALLSFKASTSGTDLAGMFSIDPAASAQFVAPGSSLDLSGVTTQQGLRSALSTSGATLDLSGVSSFDGLYAELAAKSQTLDGSVALSSASYASRLSSLRVPTLDSAGQIDMPVESLAFGLFMNESLTALIADSPDVFASVSATGLGTASNMSAFRTAMDTAGGNVGSSLSRLPMPCLAQMMDSMATGVARAADRACQPCAATGAYLHQGALSLLDPRVNTVAPGSGSSAPQIGDMPPWLGDALVAQNPQLSQQLGNVVSPTDVAASCGVGKAGTSATLSGTLPGVFGKLSTGKSAGAALPGVFGNSAASGKATSSGTPSATLPGVFGNLRGPG